MDTKTFLGKRGTVTEGGKPSGEPSRVAPVSSEGPTAVPTEEPPSVTVHRDVTPSGLTIEYVPEQWVGKLKTKREYRVNGVTVPSVTTVLDLLSKPGLSYWGNKIGASGVMELVRRGLLIVHIDWLND